MKRKSKNILLVGLGNLGLNYIKAIFSFSFNINLFIHDRKLELQNQKFKYGNNIQLFKISDLKKFNRNLDLVIVATTATKRLDLIKTLKRNKIKYWILEKLLEQNIKSTNNIYKNLMSDKCWVNIPRRAMKEYKFIKQNFNNEIETKLKLNMSGDRIVTNSIHFIDLICWISDSEVKEIDITKLKKKWVESKRKGFYEIGGTLKILLKNKSHAILKAGNNVKKSDIIISNKEMSWNVSEKNLNALRSDGLQIKMKLPLVSEIMRKVIKDIFTKKECSLPKLKEVIKNHNVLIKSLKKHWVNSKKKNVINLPVT